MLISIIEESHPLRHINDALDMHAYGDVLWFRRYFERLGEEPRFLYNDEFWEVPTRRLHEQGLAYQRSDDPLSAKLQNEEFQEVHMLCMREIALVRKMLVVQQQTIRSGAHSTLFTEGNPGHPTYRTARDSGLEVVDLDEDSRYLKELLLYIQQEEAMWGNVLRGHYDDLQRLREGEWVEKIDRSGWLICGLGHARNEWGLYERLKEKGFRYELLAFDETELDTIRRERESILSPAILKALKTP